MSAVLSEHLPALRTMTESDLPAVVEIESKVCEFPWTEGIFRDCLRVGYFCVVYENTEGVIGYGIMSIGTGECHLLNLSIHPHYQRCGLGRNLIARLLAFGRRHKARMAFLEVRRSNEDAHRLYTGMGFCEIGIHKDYYPARNGKEHAVVLAKML